MDEKETRLKQLLTENFLSDEEIDERDKLEEELGLSRHESPVKLAPEIVKSLGLQLSELKAERKALELQAQIRKEKGKIEELNQRLEGKIWCEECQDWVVD